MKNDVFRTKFWMITAVAVTVLATASAMSGQQEQLIQKQMNSVKESYRFSDWKADPGKVIPGVAISEQLFPKLKELQKVWPEDNYSLEEFDKRTLTKIRKWWRLQAEEFEVTMVVGSTFDDAKNYLIIQYAQTERQPPLIKPSGRDFGLAVGNVCFVTAEKRGEAFSSIDFIRQNVLVMMRGEGSIRYDLKAMAETLDRLLLRKKAVTEYGRLAELPKIKTFSARTKGIRVGEKVILGLRVDNPLKLELRYFWTLSGGGVERDLRGNFQYHGSEGGPQIIKVGVVNELGIYATKTMKIVVRQ
jgi:hypothetical protein